MQSIVGRERETGVLAELIGRIHERGAAPVVRSEAGIGKSTRLASASMCTRSRGMLILTTTTVRTESHLPFAGLHQLLRPLLGEVGELPDPQRDALLTAFGMTSAPAPDLFLIALAALMLIADDAQWLDRFTGDVLAFVA